MSLIKFLKRKLQKKQEKEQFSKEERDGMRNDFLEMCNIFDTIVSEEIEKVCDEKSGCDGFACDGCVGQVHPYYCDDCKCANCSCCNGYHS